MVESDVGKAFLGDSERNLRMLRGEGVITETGGWKLGARSNAGRSFRTPIFARNDEPTAKAAA